MLCSSAVSFASCASLKTSIVYVVMFCWPRTALASLVYRYFAHSSAKFPTVATAPGVTVVTVFVPRMLWPWKQLPVADIACPVRHELKAVNVWPDSWLQPVPVIVWVLYGVSVAWTVYFAFVPTGQLASSRWFVNLPLPGHEEAPTVSHVWVVRPEPAGTVNALTHCELLWQGASVPTGKGPAEPDVAT